MMPRCGATPGAVIDLMRMNQEIDLSGILHSIRLPSLVIHRAEDTLIDVEGGLSLANGIPGAKYVELPGEDHLPFVGENAYEIIDAISEFIASLPKAGVSERFLATVLVLKLEPGKGENPLDQFEDQILASVIRNGGDLFNQDRSTLAARFNGPARALRSAAEIVEMLSQAGQLVGAGIHTGEVDLSEAKAGGIAGEIAISVADLAEVGEVIVSRTVKDLSAGSGVVFEYFGTNQLANISEDWELYRVVD
jgi:hypothetical protein